MSGNEVTSRKLLAAIGVAIASAVALSTAATIYWLGGASETAELHDPTDDEEVRRVYDLPDHSGRLVGKIEGERVGLPQIEADYEVDVRGDLATVVVRQSFENPTDSTLEPTYQFPLYEKAAVYGMTMQIGERVVESEIQRKEEARETYEKAKRRGKKAALLEQDRPNLFTQRVANVESGQRVEITLRYTHPVPKERGTYRLTVPLSVAEAFTPRDMSGNRLVDGDPDDPGSEPGGEDDGTRRAAAPESVSLSVRIDGGMPITGIANYSHRVRTETLSETARRVELAPTGDPTDRHFRLGYRLAGDRTQVGVNSYWDEDDGEGYLDLLIEPPAEVAAEQVPNREFIFVVDRSGSMNNRSSGRIDRAREFVTRALDLLRPDDWFRIVTFANSPDRFDRAPTRATPENIQRAKDHLSNISANGGTRMAPALEHALRPEPIEETMRMVTVVTDVKVSNEFDVIQTIREHIGEARMFALGLGGNVNRYLLEEIARAGRGFSRQVAGGEDVDRAIDDAVRRLQSPVLTDISIDWGELAVAGVTPERIPDVYEGGSVRVHARNAEPGGDWIEVHGRLGGEEVTFDKYVELAATTDEGKAVELGWARRRIQDAMHMLNTPDKMRPDGIDDETLRDRITELGLDYSLSTQWTSFVAVADDQPLESSASESADRDLDIINSPRRARKTPDSARQKRMAAPSPSPSNDSSGGGNLEIIRGDSGGSARGGGGGASATRSPEPPSPGGDGPDELSLDAFGGSGGGGSGRSESDDSAKDPDPQIELQSPEVDDGLPADEVRDVARQHRRELKQCYADALDDDPQIAGRLTVNFVVQPDGGLASVSVDDETLGDDSVGECVRDQVRDWSLPAPDDGEVRVEFGIDFETN